ncbi:MAG: hypothetical protein U5N55_08365 [Cypionkella sp.]|nr:hypothetical protein [Cypionkella sp.]
MLIKGILIFLLGMALLGMIGNAVFKASGRKPLRPGIANAAICPQCGKRDVAGALLGRKTCGCGTK